MQAEQPNSSYSAVARSAQENAAPALSAGAAAAAPAVQPAYQNTSEPVAKYAPAGLGEASGGRKSGPLVIAVLLLLVIIGSAIVWLRPGSAPSGKVLILTPQQSSLTVEPNGTAQLGVAVQGDAGAGVTWKIQESYGGKVEPAGVTVQGQEFIYRAKYHAGVTPGDYHILATSLANKESRVTISIHVER